MHTPLWRKRQAQRKRAKVLEGIFKGAIIFLIGFSCYVMFLQELAKQ